MIAKGRFADPEAGSAFEAGGSDRLAILFGSRLGGIVAGQTPWGFVRSSERAGVSRLFLRDHRRAWYVAGVREFPSTSQLAELIELLARGYRRTVLFGASMGGFGALLYARLVGLDAVVVNPQTVITPAALEAMGDDRWPEDIRLAMAEAVGPGRSFQVDLAPLPWHAGIVRIIYAGGQPLDVAHAERMAGPGVELDRRDSTAHDLARHLAGTGELQRLISRESA